MDHKSAKYFDKSLPFVYPSLPKSEPSLYSEELLNGSLAESVRDDYYAGLMHFEDIIDRLRDDGPDACALLSLQLELMKEDRKGMVKGGVMPKTDQQFRFKCGRASLVADVLKSRLWARVKEPVDGPNWDVYWCELIALKRIFGPDAPQLKPHQRISHFRNCLEISRKHLLTQNLRDLKERFLTVLGKEYAAELNFFPMTFILPREHQQFINRLKHNTKEYWIVKPSSGAQGRGIIILGNEDQYVAWREVFDGTYSTENQIQIKKFLHSNGRWGRFPSLTSKSMGVNLDGYVVQKYIERPFLLCGRKFDIRFYVLVTSFFPLKAYMYREGFCRLSNSLFTMDNMQDMYVHLTNVSIQKTSMDYHEDAGKWNLTRIFEFISLEFSEEKLFQLLNAIDTIVVRTLQSVEQLIHQDHHCFEVYGFDVIIDEDLKPWLLEVNASPAFTPTNGEDFGLKCRVIDDTITVLNLENRLQGCERRIAGYDMFWNAGPVYADIDDINQRDTPRGKMPKLNTALGGYNMDRAENLRQHFKNNVIVKGLMNGIRTVSNKVAVRGILKQFYKSVGRRTPDVFTNRYANVPIP